MRGMAVILPNTKVRVQKRSHPQQRDAHGTAVATAWDMITPTAWVPANVTETPDGPYTLRIDPSVWRIREGDRIEDTEGRVFYVATRPKLTQIPGVPDVDFIRVTATLDPPLVP